MGSTTVWRTQGMSARDFILKHVFEPDDNYQLLDMSIRGNVAYCAVKVKNSLIYGVVVQLLRDRGDWNYRIIGENEGPRVYDCPARILDRLSPNEAEYAINWRQKCRERLAMSRKTIKDGSVITLQTPIRFTDGVSESVFRCEIVPYRRRSKKYYRRKCDNVACNINGLRNMAYTVEDAK